LVWSLLSCVPDRRRRLAADELVARRRLPRVDPARRRLEADEHFGTDDRLGTDDPSEPRN
jgi:hypothetical protein